MKTLYTDLDIRFQIDGVPVRALNIAFERFTRTIPSHSHGNGCYEIHYIPYGFGKLLANEVSYDISPNTLYVTGPHVEHEQTPLSTDPMQEYCVYLKIHSKAKSVETSHLLSAFASTCFWIGSDNQGIHTLMKQIIFELEHRYIGYQNQVELLLSQLVVYVVRNYKREQISSTGFAQNNLADSKSVIIEEYFLYEYQSLSLKTLASRLKLSPRQTQRLLNEYYGKSFCQKKADARMSAAVALLADSSRSVSSVAEALGYSSVEHFSSAFRNYYHISPQKYRKRLQTSEIQQSETCGT